MSEEKPREPIKLNRAEAEGLRRVAAERDQRLGEANGLDQYLRQLVAEVVKHRGANPSDGWNLDLAAGRITPMEVPKPPAPAEPPPVNPPSEEKEP